MGERFLHLCEWRLQRIDCCDVDAAVFYSERLKVYLRQDRGQSVCDRCCLVCQRNQRIPVLGEAWHEAGRLRHDVIN